MYQSLKPEDNLEKYEARSVFNHVAVGSLYTLLAMIMSMIFTLFLVPPGKKIDEIYMVVSSFLLGGCLTLLEAYRVSIKGYFFFARANPEDITDDNVVFTAVTDMSLYEITAMVNAETSTKNDVIILVGTTKRRGSWMIYTHAAENEPGTLSLKIRPRFVPALPFPVLETYWSYYCFPVTLADIFRHPKHFIRGDISLTIRELYAHTRNAHQYQDELDVARKIEAAWRARIRMLVRMTLQQLQILADPTVTRKSQHIQDIRIENAECLRELLADQPDISFLDVIERLCQPVLPEVPRHTKVSERHPRFFVTPDYRKKWFPELPVGQQMPKLGFRLQKLDDEPKHASSDSSNNTISTDLNSSSTSIAVS